MDDARGEGYDSFEAIERSNAILAKHPERQFTGLAADEIADQYRTVAQHDRQGTRRVSRRRYESSVYTIRRQVEPDVLDDDVDRAGFVSPFRRHAIEGASDTLHLLVFMNRPPALSCTPRYGTLYRCGGAFRLMLRNSRKFGDFDSVLAPSCVCDGYRHLRHAGQPTVESVEAGAERLEWTDHDAFHAER